MSEIAEDLKDFQELVRLEQRVKELREKLGMLTVGASDD